MNKIILSFLCIFTFFADAGEHTLSIEKSMHIEDGVKKVEISFDSTKFFDINPDLKLYLGNKAAHDFVGHYSNSMTFGFREQSDETGSGINVSWDIFTPASFPVFQASMGYEFNFLNWHFFYNGYFPLRRKFTKKSVDYVFSNRSEFGFIRKSRKWELLFAPIYHHDTREFGICAGVSYLIGTALDFNFKPYFDSRGHHRVVFSVSLNMGNNRDVLHRKRNRTQPLYFKTRKTKVKKIVKMPIVQPISVPDPILPPSQPSSLPPPEDASWWDFFLQILRG